MPERAGRGDVNSYVDDYIAGRGRDSREHEQFAANHGSEIEQELQTRTTEQGQVPEPPSSEPPPLEPYPPSYERESSHYDDSEPGHRRNEPQHDHDWEYGD